MDSTTAIIHFASICKFIMEIHLCVQRSISDASTFVLTLYTSFDHIIYLLNYLDNSWNDTGRVSRTWLSRWAFFCCL